MTKKQYSFYKKLILALIPVISLLFFLWEGVVIHESSPHLPLIGATIIASLMAKVDGIKWKTLQNSMVKAVSGTLSAIYILILIGILIGVWVISGIVPAMIHYGLLVISTKWFLPTVAITSSIVSLSTGSSWSTAGTVGIAFMGMGQALGIPEGLTAGAIISGAYFGDKMSPLSDTTNLAPAVAGTDLFTHIRHMIWTTGPSLIISLILYLIIGLYLAPSTSSHNNQLHFVLQNSFFIHWGLLLVPIIVLSLVVLKVPAIPSLTIGIISGMIAGLLTQNISIWQILEAAKSGFSPNTGLKLLDSLLSRGGMDGMMDTVALIIAAVTFGGAMEGAGYLDTITLGILKLARGRGSLILTTILTSIGLNIIAGDQYMAIVIPGKMYKKAYTSKGMHPKNLSRALEDAGTLTSPLVPWNTCGAFMSNTLGLSVISYLPFAFLNLINPVISIIYGFTGITIESLQNNNISSINSTSTKND